MKILLDILQMKNVVKNQTTEIAFVGVTLDKILSILPCQLNLLRIRNVLYCLIFSNCYGNWENKLNVFLLQGFKTAK